MNVPCIEFLSVSNLLQHYFLEFGIPSRGTLLNHLFPSIVSSLRSTLHLSLPLFLFSKKDRHKEDSFKITWTSEKSRAGLQTIFPTFYR